MTRGNTVINADRAKDGRNLRTRSITGKNNTLRSGISRAGKAARDRIAYESGGE